MDPVGHPEPDNPSTIYRDRFRSTHPDAIERIAAIAEACSGSGGEVLTGRRSQAADRGSADIGAVIGWLRALGDATGGRPETIVNGWD